VYCGLRQAVEAPEPAKGAKAAKGAKGGNTKRKSAKAGRANSVLARSTLKHAHVQGVLNTLLVGKKLWLVWKPGKSGPPKALLRKRVRSHEPLD
jgi:glucose-6-phosphate dehydrogenase assembly protein OpcA